MADDDSRDDARATTAIDGAELRKLVDAARSESHPAGSGDGASAASTADAAASSRPTEGVAPIVMIVDRPLKVVDGEVQSKAARAAKLKTVSRFRALGAAAQVADSLEAAIARQSGLAAEGADDDARDTVIDPPAAFAPPADAAPGKRRDGLISLEAGLEPVRVDTASTTRIADHALKPRFRRPPAPEPSGVAVARRGIDGYVLAALAIVLAGVLFIAFG